MKNLTDLLDLIEDRIDEDHLRFVEQLHLDTLDYKEVPFLPLTTVFDPPEFTPYPYSEAYYDPEKMMFNELLHSIGGAGVLSSVLAKDHYPLHIRSNHGIGILASLLGANCRIVNDLMPYVDEMNEEQIRKVVDHGVPEIDHGLPVVVNETHAYYKERLKDYPKCQRWIHITQPDLQGPFDIAHLLLGSEIYMMVYTDPELLHELLSIITDTCIKYLHFLEGTINDHIREDAIVIHGDVYGGNTLIKDDSAIINISESMYSEFSGPYNKKILEVMGGGSMHYCGKAYPWHNRQLDCPWIRGVNYGNPELQDLKTNMDYWAPKKVPNIFWGDGLRLTRLEGTDFSREAKDAGVTTGLSLIARVADLDEAKRLM